jgi:hypothetical protein
VRAVADDEVGAGVDDHAGETHDVAARLAVILFVGEWQAGHVAAFRATMKRHDDNVV